MKQKCYGPVIGYYWKGVFISPFRFDHFVLIRVVNRIAIGIIQDTVIKSDAEAPQFVKIGCRVSVIGRRNGLSGSGITGMGHMASDP